MFAPGARPGPAWLFCPSDRPDRFAKAASLADIVIIDLEDGVGPADKATARTALMDNRLDPGRTVVRVNSFGSAEHALDLTILARSHYRTVMLAKTESAHQVTSLAPLTVVALIETPRGVVHASEIAGADNTVAMMWGAEDLIAGLGGISSRDTAGGYRDVARHARSTVLLAAVSCGRYAIDAVHLEIADLAGLSIEASDAAASGFSATACIHPTQIAVVRQAFRPSPADILWATEVLKAAQSAAGVFVFQGRMVDAPLLRHATTIVARAQLG